MAKQVRPPRGAYSLVQLRAAFHRRTSSLDLYIGAPDLDVGQERAKKRVLLVAGVVTLTVEPHNYSSVLLRSCVVRKDLTANACFREKFPGQ